MSDVADKWGEAVASRGFAQLPNYLLLLNQFIDEEATLSPTELLILIQLVGTWWKRDEMPFPSMSTLAKRCGVSTRQVQRSINRLVMLGLIERTKRRTSGIISSNAYDLQPLVKTLHAVAKAYPNEFKRNVRTVKSARTSSDADAVQTYLKEDRAAYEEFMAEREKARVRGILDNSTPEKKKRKPLKRPRASTAT